MPRFIKDLKNGFGCVSTKVKTAAFVAATTALTAAPAFAAPTVDDIWTAVDLSAIQGKVIPLAVIVIGITLVGVALALGKSAAKKAKGSL